MFESFLPKFRDLALQHWSKLRPVRPGWLAKKGYLISYLDTGAERKLMDLIAPKQKYHSKWERVLMAAGLEDYLYSASPGQIVFLPSVLHELKSLRYDRPVLAIRLHGKHRPAFTALYLVEREGMRKWIMLHKLANDLMPLAKSFTDQLQGLVPENKRKLLWEGLQLGER